MIGQADQDHVALRARMAPLILTVRPDPHSVIHIDGIGQEQVFKRDVVYPHYVRTREAQFDMIADFMTIKLKQPCDIANICFAPQRLIVNDADIVSLCQIGDPVRSEILDEDEMVFARTSGKDIIAVQSLDLVVPRAT